MEIVSSTRILPQILLLVAFSLGKYQDPTLYEITPSYTSGEIFHGSHEAPTTSGEQLSPSLLRDHEHDDEQLRRSEQTADCGFSCLADEMCISATKVCDNFVDCTDSSDELNCTCKERIGLKKHCDRIADCLDGKDEVGCGGCSAHEFSCNAMERESKSRCIPIGKRCDGHKDCSYNEDEEHCFRLLSPEEDARGIHSAGFLQKRIGHEWFTVCKGAKSEHVLTRYVEKACISIVGKTMTQTPTYSRKPFNNKILKHFEQLNMSFVLLGDSDGKFTKIKGQCPSKSIISVVCPNPECGWEADPVLKSRSKRHNNDHDLDKLSEITAKIVGGQDSAAGKWPSLVGIYRNGSFHCGGSIIDNLWILTAAHCFASYEKYVFEIQAGMLRRFSWSPHEQARQVKNIFIHERYDSKIFLNDIALMKLDRPLHLSKWVSTACLVRSDQLHLDPHVGQSCIVSGWGDLAESVRGPDHMQEVALPVIAKCAETFTKDTMQICAGVKEGGHDACQGDSGGPFACSDDKGRHIVAGVVSFGRGCARPSQPGVYTRVSYYTSWIDSVVSGTNQIVKTQKPPLQCEHDRCVRTGGECMFPKMICDRKVDCLDASDESDCDFKDDPYFHSDVQIDHRAYSEVIEASHGKDEHSHNYGSAKLCGPTEFQCATTKGCVPDLVRCDGYQDCSDNTDEKHCDCGTIIANQFPQLKCDFFKNCLDGSDESDSECDYCAGKHNHMKCPFSNTCILQQNWCDGIKHCPDGEDEVDCIRLVRSKSAIQVAGDFLGDKISRGLHTGYAVLREKGKTWTPACEDEIEMGESFNDIVCSYLGFRVQNSSSPPAAWTRTRRFSRVYIPRPLPKEERPEIWSRSYGNDDSIEGKLAKNCTPVKVTCGELNCGIQKAYARSRRSPTATELGSQPWFAVITFEGSAICGATLVNKNWLAVSTGCLLYLTDKAYVAGFFGFSNASIYVTSPAEQIKRINSIDKVPGGLSYFHLESPIKADHFANPICTKIGDEIEPEDLDRADCRKVSVTGSQSIPILDERVEVDVLHSRKGSHFSIKTNDKLCQESKESFVYCTTDGSTWYFLGFLNQEINVEQCQRDKFVQLFNPFYGVNASKTLELLKSPPTQNVPPPKCQGVRCSSGICIEKKYVCDSITDCADAEDEKRCSRHYQGIQLSSEDEDEDVEAPIPNTSTNTVDLPSPSKSKCSIGHFPCRSTGNCIPINGWCDGVFDCGMDDFTDEPDVSECSCRHYLAIASPESVCDSVVHCPNREDETEICPCNQNSFHCSSNTNTTKNTIKCINHVFVCDGNTDCAQGEDESHCFELSTSLTLLESDPTKLEGYVVVMVKGSWHPYCSNMWSQELGSKICSNLNPSKKLESLETFDVSRFNFEDVLLVTDEYGTDENYRVAKVDGDLFNSDENTEWSSCELGYVKCIL